MPTSSDCGDCVCLCLDWAAVSALPKQWVLSCLSSPFYCPGLNGCYLTLHGFCQITVNTTSLTPSWPSLHLFIFESTFAPFSHCTFLTLTVSYRSPGKSPFLIHCIGAGLPLISCAMTILLDGASLASISPPSLAIPISMSYCGLSYASSLFQSLLSSLQGPTHLGKGPDSQKITSWP